MYIVLGLPIGKQKFKFLKFKKGGITNIKSMATKVNNGNEKYSAILVSRFFCYKVINLKKKTNVIFACTCPGRFFQFVLSI